MRKIILMMPVSADGFIKGPEREPDDTPRSIQPQLGSSLRIRLRRPSLSTIEFVPMTCTVPAVGCSDSQDRSVHIPDHVR